MSIIDNNECRWQFICQRTYRHTYRCFSILSIYRGLRLIVPRFWQTKIEPIRGIGIIELLRELFYYMRVHFGRGKFWTIKRCEPLTSSLSSRGPCTSIRCIWTLEATEDGAKAGRGAVCLESSVATICRATKNELLAFPHSFDLTNVLMTLQRKMKYGKFPSNLSGLTRQRRSRSDK